MVVFEYKPTRVEEYGPALPWKGGPQALVRILISAPGGRFMYDYRAPGPTRHFYLRSPDTRRTNGLCITFPKCRPCAYRKCNQILTIRDPLNCTISPTWTASATHSGRNSHTRPSIQRLKMTSRRATIDQMRVLLQRKRPSRGSNTPFLHYWVLRCYGRGEIPYLDDKAQYVC